MASLSFAGLLLLLLAASSSAVVVLAKPVVEYHSYAVTPLSPDAYTASATDNAAAVDAVEDATTTTMSTPTTLHVRLVHRDSLAVNATAAELLARRLERDDRRAAWIISKASAAANGNGNSTPVAGYTGAGGRGRLEAPVTSGAPSGDYIAKIVVGTPGTEALLVPDTGSDVSWLQCKPCLRCYHQSKPIYEPSSSRTYRTVACRAPACRALLNAGSCEPHRNTCTYRVRYGDGSTTAGDLVTETLAFAGGVRVPGVAIGCGHDNKGLFASPAAGILGLGRGAASFPSQIAGRYGRGFSYCLVDLMSGHSSTLTFGAAQSPPASSFTPMVSNSHMGMRSFYYVQLVGVSVGGVRVPGVVESDLRLDPSTGRGGVIVDSGTTITRLANPAYVAFRDAFRVAAKKLGPRSPGRVSLFDTCYKMPGGHVKVPTVSMHFAGGVEVKLPPKNYLISMDSKGTVCFAFASSSNHGISIIGNTQQQGFRVVYDVDGRRIGFAPHSC